MKWSEPKLSTVIETKTYKHLMETNVKGKSRTKSYHLDFLLIL